MFHINQNNVFTKFNRKTLFTQLLYPYDGKEKQYNYTPPSTQGLLEEAITVMGSGVEEASNAMMYGLYHLCSTKDVYDRVKQELRRVWPDKEAQINWMDLERSSYFVSRFPLQDKDIL